MPNSCKGKSSWPELVNAPAEIAVKIIEKQNSSVKAIVVEEGSSVVTNFECGRVFVFVHKKTNNVTKTPRIG
ncbi:inhibitor of trypsin and hageman factor-like [Cucumis melo var. makuwa]|uniref:Inhibitor of trypsin and hageman factor-like n=2 Tax=Cucumis melo TaxID=3656 RepID=A0A5D3D0M4_CUCMM|nr:inhibitor of trypsin and hageman factor-like [Cucumis melo var. makuwa]TYK17265.1 inhibitor of trypsin and hageman factor-like [Cucumis melo var. makuwa]